MCRVPWIALWVDLTGWNHAIKAEHPKAAGLWARLRRTIQGLLSWIWPRVIGNARMAEVNYGPAGLDCVAGQGIAEAVTLCRVLSFMRLAKVLARLRKQRVCPSAGGADA